MFIHGVYPIKGLTMFGRYFRFMGIKLREFRWKTGSFCLPILTKSFRKICWYTLMLQVDCSGSLWCPKTNQNHHVVIHRIIMNIIIINVGSWLVWGYTIVSTDPKIIVNLWTWWGGTLLCPQDFGLSLFSFLFKLF